MRFFAVIAVSLLSGAWALGEGDLQFTLAGRNYTTQNAAALVQTKNGKSRIIIAVKDISQRFLLMMTADVAAGREKQALSLNSVDTEIAVTLRTQQGAFALLPQQQLAKETNLTYSERVDIVTGEIEDEAESDADISDRLNGKHREKRKRKKIRSEYRRIKPAWIKMSRTDRLNSGAGVIENGAFRDTHFTLQLTPNVVNGKVVSYQGSFAGSGRFAQGNSAGVIKSISGGSFRVRVENAP
jgi:hypothetical protein